MASPGATGATQNVGNERAARKLLKPRRRAQIEVWLDEAVSWRDTQHCAAGMLFGHRSDALAASPVDRPGDDSSHYMSRIDICPVCGRSPEGEEPVAHQAGNEQLYPDGVKLGKGKHVFRGIRTVMGHLGARNGGRSEVEEDGWGRTASTQMFRAEASEYGSSLGAALSSSGSTAAGGGGNKALDERMGRLMRAQKLLDRSQAKR